MQRGCSRSRSRNRRVRRSWLKPAPCVNMKRPCGISSKKCRFISSSSSWSASLRGALKMTCSSVSIILSRDCLRATFLKEVRSVEQRSLRYIDNSHRIVCLQLEIRYKMFFLIMLLLITEFSCYQVSDGHKFWKFMTNTAIPNMYNMERYNGAPTKKRERLFLSDLNNFRVGSVRLRQVRVVPSKNDYYSHFA